MKELEKIVDSNGEPLEIVDAEARADISEIKQSLSDFEILEKTASGDIVSFDDGSDLPMPSLKVAIEPQQDLHGYDSPWVGGAGKNKLENIFSGTVWAIVGNDGSITLNGTTISVNWLTINENVTLKAGTYTLSGTPLNAPSGLHIYDDGTFGNWSDQSGTGVSKTFSEDTTGKILLRVPAGTYNNLKIYPMIENGSSKTTFAPYSNICPISGWDVVNVTVADDVETPTVSNVYTIDLDGTRYGGTLDVVSGVLTVDRVSLTVDENSNVISGSSGLPFRIDLLTGAKASSSTSALTGVKCNFLKEVTQSSSWGVDGTFSRVTTDAKIVYFKVNSEITTVQQLKTFLQSNNLQFVYELATPLTIQLTPTQVKSLLGHNNLWADTGNIELTYLTNNPLTQTVYDMVKILVEQST